MGMRFEEEDLSVGHEMPSSDGYEDEGNFQEQTPVYESPAKVQYESPGVGPDHGPSLSGLNRTPPRKISGVEEYKQPQSYTKVQDSIPTPTIPPSAPSDAWSKGGAGGGMYGGAGMYAGARPQNYAVPAEMQRPQTTPQSYYSEAPPLRYGLNETGSYIPQHPKLMHANSTPVTGMASPSYPTQASNSGKYKNENVL